jgi:hypothetical protein
MKGNGLKVEATVEVDSSDNVLKGRHDAFNGGDMLLFKG